MNNRFLPRTLGARLTALIFVSTSVILALSGAALYEALRSRMSLAASGHMQATLEALQADLANVRATSHISNHPHVWTDQMEGHQNMDMAIYDMAGRRLVSTRGFQPFALLGDLPPDRRNAAFDTRGARFRYITALARLAGDCVSVRVVVQYDKSENLASLRAHAWTIMLIEVVGVGIAAAFAYAITVFGLSPLRRFVSYAEEMSTCRLAQPLSGFDTSQELKELEHAFNGMLERLNDSFTRLGQFSSNLAHDMRTPLTNLQAAAQVALSLPRSTEEYRDVIESSVEEYQRLSGMVEDMLFLARSEKAHTLVKVCLLDAVVEAGRVAGYYETVASDAGVTIELSGRAEVRADLLLFQRALSNLLSNALAHAPRGSVIFVTCREKAGAAEIAVTDTGEGIGREHVDRIFERFYRIDPSRHNRGSGTGLGLAIVKSIMENHGGQCGVESCPGVRTTFWLRFPFADVNREAGSGDAS
ncbi:heavy metal sensor histidine kinase [Paraburkholderia caribensis]|uniref:Sensor protein n=1 Tax=Paraburkholderia caribensis TaxID=75105 RepID=A0A9Q6WPH8_9BURK|nr:heavy metal sensor histidine kinase [Paraburkholderia caribensis]MCO4882496.1 heavy metal sensor histidine kinase [Paraburkholderia caribensis]PTB24116.1 histidine kinase [Paraburkholderia caribensis]QLB66153.1 histidine kinase [Paraburkholderia caribensis]